MPTDFSKCMKATLVEALTRIEVEAEPGPIAVIIDEIQRRDRARRVRDLNRRATRCHQQLALLLEEDPR